MAHSNTPADGPIEFPPLQEAQLDEQGLATLFGDLSLAAEILQVRVKGHATGRASAEQGTLSHARQALLEQRAVQLVYRYKGEHWIDTLTPGTTGVRLIRTRFAAVPSAG